MLPSGLTVNQPMNKHFKANERELVKVVTFFKKQSKKLIEEGKLGEEHKTVQTAVDKFVEQMEKHADTRAFILEQRGHLQKLVKDNAQCPTCHKKDMLKLVGTEKNEKEWKSNRYKCRRCNIEFTWNLPNNPWDMLQYIDEVLQLMRSKYSDASTANDEKEQITAAITGMEANLQKLKPVDVIFLDLELPGINGYDILDKLKRDARFSSVPIVAYTVHVSEINQARKLGFHSFIGKPLDADLFPRQLERILKGEHVWALP